MHDRPVIAFWEMTQACDLICKHCRASAQPDRDAAELSTHEGFRLLDTLAEAKVPLVVLTGGDPAKRPDLAGQVGQGVAAGLRIAITLSATPLVTPRVIGDMAFEGASRIAISIDGPDAKIHDEFRGRRGSFDHSIRILRQASAANLETQINTMVHTETIERLDELAEIVLSLEATLWSVFYIVPTGRADAQMLPSAEAVERSLEKLADIAERAPFRIKTTAAPHYRRVVAQRRSTPRGSPRPAGALRVNDGRGLLFISHRGDIFPSGFLPIGCGNVRTHDPIEVYRRHPTFRSLRDTDELKGRCGACEYKRLCGGSRARAYAMTGDALASDPLCSYEPGSAPLPAELSA